MNANFAAVLPELRQAIPHAAGQVVRRMRYKLPPGEVAGSASSK